MARTIVILVLLFFFACMMQSTLASPLNKNIFKLPKINTKRLKVAALMVMSASKLHSFLKKSHITCETYEDHCSKIIEQSPNLKENSEKYQKNCEERIKPHVCKNVVTSTSTEPSDVIVL